MKAIEVCGPSLEKCTAWLLDGAPTKPPEAVHAGSASASASASAAAPYSSATSSSSSDEDDEDQPLHNRVLQSAKPAAALSVKASGKKRMAAAAAAGDAAGGAATAGAARAARLAPSAKASCKQPTAATTGAAGAARAARLAPSAKASCKQPTAATTAAAGAARAPRLAPSAKASCKQPTAATTAAAAAAAAARAANPTAQPAATHARGEPSAAVPSYRVGALVSGRWWINQGERAPSHRYSSGEQHDWYPGTVTVAHVDGTVDVRYTDESYVPHVPREHVRPRTDH
jgi:hypothetical protein